MWLRNKSNTQHTDYHNLSCHDVVSQTHNEQLHVINTALIITNELAVYETMHPYA